ncbi:mycofactocin-coupled SDR family oxidoreductase [Pseudonocardia yuanmonensis]|uniref:Mycofactocin-coupled SDR family oxidoreductase n=1 Tax=Pseudonocardia yuanmonensis TaxID=1095914 RepID=A0ABP8WTG9_9PSEU
MGKLEGKVALVTGAARGQGRSHALRLAEEGADIIAVDICAQVETVAYPMSTKEDLDETVAEVEKLDRRIVAHVADVRDEKALAAAVADGVATLGGVDIVLANAGIASIGTAEDGNEAAVFRTLIDINLTGVWNTVHAAAPTMIEQGRGGAVVLTSSTQGLTGRGGNGTASMDGYCASKHGVVGLMRTFAHWLAPHNIRVNSIHPTGVSTPMIVNPVVERFLAESADVGDALANLMDVPTVEPRDISNAIVWLVSDEGRYVTGTTLPVDAGFTVR